jgi:two-component system response regulator
MERHEVEILLVEDNPNDLELALHAFRRHQLGNNVRIARDGVEALTALFGDGDAAPIRPRLVLLDLKLPKVDGVEVLRRIRADPRTCLLPVVVMTASAQERDVADCYRLGANSYIVKPVDFEQFSDAVRQLGFYWVLLNQGPPTS